MSRARNHETAEALVQAAAGAVAEQYVAVVPTPSFGLVLDAFKAGQECQALFDYIEEHDAWSLADDYFSALRDHLRDRLEMRVEAGSSEGELRYLLLEP
jgi:hypothetical protein